MNIISYSNYGILQRDFVVSSSALVGRGYGILRDHSEDFTLKDLEKYFSQSCGRFLKKFNEFKKLKRKVTPTEEKQLLFMLGTLIDTNIILQEHKKRRRSME